MSRPRIITGRPTTMATEGMIATPHYLASIAGLRILQDGGNALDAAIAANAVLNVVYPHQCSVGGDAFMLIWDPRTARLYGLNGSGRAPAAATVERLHELGHDNMPARGSLPVTVPGAVDAWQTALERFGARPLAELLAPAIGYAEHGFPISSRLSAYIGSAESLLRQQPAIAEQFLPGGVVPAPGTRLRQPKLAATLRLIAERGRDAVYQGPIGASIARTLRAHGGLMTEADLAAHRSEWVEPISTTYRGFELVELPPNTQGITALQLANIAEGFDVAALGHNTAAQVHHFVEAKKLAFHDRDRFVGDPAFVEVPVERLNSKQYAAELRAGIDPARAATSVPDKPGDGDTVYLCAVDRDGLCVSLIQSLFMGFGSGLVAEEAGIVLHNRGASFTFADGAANRLEPGKRPMHTLIPALLMRDGVPHTVLGTMGGHGQAQTHLQLLSNLVDFELEPQEAVEAPRWLSGQLAPDDAEHVLRLEERYDSTVIAGLRQMGHDVVVTEPFAHVMGHAHMIQIDREQGVLKGGSDPRADGVALGW